MGHLLITNSPIGGMDSDTEDYAIAPEDYRDAVNIRNTYTYTNAQKTSGPVKGNLLVSFDLGNQKNKCVGTLEDKKNNAVIYFVHRDGTTGVILGWYPEKTDPLNPNGVIELLFEADFGWTFETNIHSSNIVDGKLLYWVDPLPRKINIVKSSLNNKLKSWKVYLPADYVVPTDTFNIVVRNYPGSTVVYTGTTGTSSGQTIQGAFESIADDINSSPLNQYLKAEACDCSITITETQVNSYDFIFTNAAYIIVAENWYGPVPQPRFWDVNKYTSLFQPNLEFRKNPNYEFNRVAKKVFQARLQYTFDDYEQSVLSPISNIPTNNLGCDGNFEDSYNYIRINFNDPLLIDPNLWVLLKEVKVLVREHNVGSWFIVDTLEPCDFYFDNAGQPACWYDFYNDTNALAVDATLVNQPYDFVPQKADTQYIVENRLAYGAPTDNFDMPDCIQARATIDFEDDPPQKLYRIRFKVKILTWSLGDDEHQGSGYGFYELFPNYDKYPFWQSANPDINYVLQRGGIFRDTSKEENIAFYGGGGFGASAGGDFGITDGMGGKWDQRCPLRGFPVFFANTPYFGVSRQIDVSLPADSKGALDISTVDYINGIGQYLYQTENNDLYSIVEIWAPAGEYIARVGSNLCSYGDVLGCGSAYDLNGGLGFQKTSAPVWGTFAAGGGPYTPGSWQQTKEIRITVTNSDIDDAGTFLIMDLAPPHDLDLNGDDFWQPFGCYLYDSKGETDVNSVDYNGLPVELTTIKYEGPAKWSSYALSDHNGFFFGIYGTRAPMAVDDPPDSDVYMRFLVTQVNNTELTFSRVVHVGTLSNLFSKTLVSTNYIPIYSDNKAIYGILTTDTADARQDCSTVVVGNVIDPDGNPVSGISVVFENGTYTNTNSNGKYDFVAWGDMVTPNLANFSSPVFVFTDGTKRQDDLIFNGNAFCLLIYPFGQELGLNIDPIGPSGYNPTNKFIVSDFIIQENFDPSVKRLKRGGRYIWVIRCSDSQSRLGNCVHAFETYIPFITEDLGKYLPDQYAPGTFKRGKPLVNWEINPATLPPVEAASFQFLRTKNLIYGDYLQWVINNVVYLSKVGNINQEEVVTDYENYDAVAVKLSIKNILDYFSTNPDSQISYSFVKGDTVRFIADRSMTYYDKLIEAEIVDYDEVNMQLILKTDNLDFKVLSGTFIEHFVPSEIETKAAETFVEVGESFPCTTPGIPGNQWGITSGTFTNGDTYWRGRYIVVNDEADEFNAAYPVTVEDASLSDFAISKDQDMGRIGAIDQQYRRLYRSNAIRISNVYLPDTAINGLSAFRNIKDKELDRAFGPIQRLILAGYILLVVCANKCVSTYVGRVLVHTGPNDALQALTDDVIGDVRALQGEVGTQHPESVREFNGYVYGFDANRGVVWRYAGDGINEISTMYKMRSFFSYFIRNGVWSAQAIVDKLYNEYILTIYEKKRSTGTMGVNYVDAIEPIPGIENTDYILIVYTGSDGVKKQAYAPIVEVDGTKIYVDIDVEITGPVMFYYKSSPVTVAFAESKNKFPTRYSFTPECYGSIDKEMVSFIDGQLWVHDKNDVHNNFYGIQYTSKINLIQNASVMEPQDVKMWFALMINSVQSDGGFNWSVPVITNKANQLSRILTANFKKGEEYWDAAYKKDLNTPVANPIVNGRVLRNATITLLLENDTTGNFELRAITSRVEVSYRNTK